MNPEYPELAGLIDGILMAGFVVVGLFFLSFWRRTGDRLFLAFAAAFALLALAEPLPLITHDQGAQGGAAYLPRLGAFALIIAAIVHKNLGRGRPRK